MKKIVCLLLTMVPLYQVVFSQCGVNQEELRTKYCTGSYLVHSVLDNASPTVGIALKDGIEYAIYLIDPSHPIEKFCLFNSKNALMNTELMRNKEENYLVCTFVPPVTDTYVFSAEFDTEEKACVLWAVYMQNEKRLKPGIYKSFEELKYNSPSVDFNYDFNKRSNNYAGNKLDFYKVDIDKIKGKTIGKVLGFSDGSNVYINENYPKLNHKPEFSRVEFIGRYYYYQVIQYVPISTGTVTTMIATPVQKIMDMNTGESVILNRKTLKEIIADDQNLLNEFMDESKKNRKLKEYLAQYFERKSMKLSKEEVKCE